jgi:hypothetical protein
LVNNLILQKKIKRCKLEIINKLYPHALVILGFVLVSLIYFYPVYRENKSTNLILLNTLGMAKEQNDFRAAEDVEPYWTNSALGECRPIN